MPLNDTAPFRAGLIGVAGPATSTLRRWRNCHGHGVSVWPERLARCR
ncbi:MAG: hypothetical protein JKY00_00505 [Roseicyclus sp.]|nr:hypothetical protein [Roseicyclus sp.]